MERYDEIYRLYDEFDTERLREYQRFVDVFPPVDSRVALEFYDQASDALAAQKDEIRAAFSDAGETYAELAARATRDQAFTALDLYGKYGRAVNVLVLDVDETLRSAGGTDNEIPRETLHLLTEFHERDVPIVVCTGQTLENVKGFMIQGLGNELVHSGSFGIVYEGGTGVFAPGHGSDTKQLLYEELDEGIRETFESVRTRVLSDAPEKLRRGCHLQGNEFNVTLKPNFETGSQDAVEVIDDALAHMLDLLDDAVGGGEAGDTGTDGAAADGDAGGDDGEVDETGWARAFYAAEDPEIRSVLEAKNGMPDLARSDVPDRAADLFERIDVAYYRGDAAEIASRELNKVVGVQAAFDVLDVADPFALVMGDSKSDLRVMEYVAANDCGISAAPKHASRDVLDHVISTDELLFDRGESAAMLRTAYALNGLARLDGEARTPE